MTEFDKVVAVCCVQNRPGSSVQTKQTPWVQRHWHGEQHSHRRSDFQSLILYNFYTTYLLNQLN